MVVIAALVQCPVPSSAHVHPGLTWSARASSSHPTVAPFFGGGIGLVIILMFCPAASHR